MKKGKWKARLAELQATQKKDKKQFKEFKEMTGVSRKYTIPLIEYFDKSQITVRVGDSRVLRKR